MDRASQVERNFQAFQSRLPELLPTYIGKIAVLHDGDIVDFFDSFADAVKFGQEKFGATGSFSVQEVAAPIQSLGYYSYAVGHLHQ